jgi:hypothetical protein
MSRAENLGELALQFHGLVMNGGFLDSFAASDAPLDRVVEAFRHLGLNEAAEAIAAGIALVPGSGTAPSDVRLGILDDLNEPEAGQLEALGHRYEELVSDALLDRQISALARPMKTLPDTMEGLLREYVDSLVRRDEALHAHKVAAANRLSDRAHTVALRLRTTNDGRSAMESLLTHENRAIRMSAAAESLGWGPEKAIPVLEALVVPRGTQSLDAEYTLREYRAGKLRFDW